MRVRRTARDQKIISIFAVMKEQWKDIPGYEGKYQVSDQGRVKSLDRTIVRSTGVKHKIKGRILKPSNPTTDYPTVSLGLNNPKKVHQLVAEAFLDHKPCGHQLVVDHIDHDKTNNKLENLRLTSQRENTSRRKTKGSSKYTGVCWDKHAKQWKVAIRVDGKRKYLGYFKDELEAAQAYQDALAVIAADVADPKGQ